MERGKIKPLLQECSLLVACLQMVEKSCTEEQQKVGEVSKTLTTSFELSIFER